MSKIRKIAVVFVIVEILCLLVANLYVGKYYQKLNAKEYKVEINRIKHELENGTLPESIDFEKYKRVIKVSVFDPKKTCDGEYTVELVNQTLYRFEYSRASAYKILAVINLSYLVMIALTLCMFTYLERKIISPFSRMNSITKELSKGNLTVPIKQEKSKYFKDFLWGLDMLRDKLESDKQRELELLREKKLMVLSLSHDIKTPLSASELYIKALIKDLYKSEEKRQEALLGIEKNLEEIKGYVGEIVKASREDFLSFSVKNQEFYLQNLIEELKSYYREKCEQLHIDFEIENMDNCILYGDFDRTIEVLQNVMENAIKYGDGEKITLSSSEEEGCKLLTLMNTGCKLKEEEVPHLFDSFYRGSSSRNVEGNGLGLFICKELMHKMDGDIFAKVKANKFSIVLVLRKL